MSVKRLACTFLFCLVNCPAGLVLAKYPEVREPKRPQLSRPNPAVPRLIMSYPKNSAPGNRSAAVTRGPCDANPPLTALVPNGQLGLTALEHPTLWFFVPEMIPQPLRLEITDLQGHSLLRKEYPYNGKPGIVSLKIEATLKPNTAYNWQFMFVCQEDGQDPTVSGRIQRTGQSAIVLSDRTQLLRAARKGLWFDVLSAVAEHRYRQPQDMQNNLDWRTLMRSVDLDFLGRTQVMPCCSQ